MQYLINISIILLLISINSAAIDNQNDKMLIDRWLDLIDLQSNTEMESFQYMDYASSLHWTELYDDTLIFSMKVFKNAASLASKMSEATPDDIPRKLLIKHLNHWSTLITAFQYVHKNGVLWRPNIDIIIFRMNGYIIGKFKYTDPMTLVEIKVDVK